MLFRSAVYKKKMCTIIVKNAGTYFGEVKSEEMRMVRYAYHTLEYMLQREFKGFRRLYSTPASTGRKLIEMSLPENRRYERLDDKSCEFLKVNFGQGRVEVFNQAIINDEKVEYKYIGNGGMDRVDGRLMYGACMSHLPVGQCTHEISCEVYMSYTQDDKVFPLYPGFYRVEFMPPSDWKHIGLLPVRLSYDKMCYPNVSGCFHESYCTGEELAVAIENKWHCFVKESWLWRDTQKITDPLATWKKKIMKCYDATENTYIKSAIRRIILHTLGSFVQFNDIKERVTFRPTFIELGKIGARNLEKIVRSRAETITWLENVPLPPSRQKWVHPEWSRMAWGRARARVARMALKIPFKYIVGIMTDEILCCDLPKEIKEQIFIDDTHRPGSFRIKGKIDGSMLWPQTPLELRMILERENIKDETRT